MAKRKFEEVTINNIARGKLINVINVNLRNMIEETLAEAALSNANMGSVELKDVKAKLNIEISIAMLDDINYEVRGKVKKTLPTSSCTSIALEDGSSLVFRAEGGDEYSPEQRTIEQEILETEDEIKVYRKQKKGES